MVYCEKQKGCWGNDSSELCPEKGRSETKCHAVSTASQVYESGDMCKNQSLEMTVCCFASVLGGGYAM